MPASKLRTAALAALLPLAVGCIRTPPDTPDGIGDTAKADTGAVDTLPVGDTGRSETAATDSAGESATHDTGVVDTTPRRPERTWYTDTDGDGWGGAEVGGCPPPEDAVARGGDCDDADAAVHPGAVESVCDGTIDLNCDGSVGMADADGDGWVACEDCDDARAAVNPGASETWGDADDADCDGTIDDRPDPDASLYGEAEGRYAGTALAGGDLDGDGYGDLLIGGHGWSDSKGVAYVILGPVSGDVQLSDAQADLRGSSDDSEFGGSAVASADVNGDGLSDVIVGVGGPGSDDGGVGVYLSPVVGGLTEDDAETWWLGDAFFGAGRSLANMGDLDGDAREDLFVGSAASAAYLLLDLDAGGDLSLADAPLRLATEGTVILAQFTTVANAGDTDGDGVADLLVGSLDDTDAGWRAGAAWIVSGDTRGNVSLADADAKLLGEAEWDWAGYAVDGVGDTNGDGLDDVAITTGLAGPGRIYLVYGGTSGVSRLASADAVWEGATGSGGMQVVGLGDVDGDGFPDMAIGDPEDGTLGVMAGAVHVVYAPGPGTHDLAAEPPIREADSYALGVSIGAIGDIDADGHADLAYGLPYDARGIGRVVVLYGG